MEARGVYVHPTQYNLMLTAKQYVASKHMGADIASCFSKSLLQKDGTNMAEQCLVLVGGRNSIRQGLAMGGSRKLVAGPHQQLFAEFIHVDSHKGLAALGGGLMAGQAVFAPFVHAATASGARQFGQTMANIYSPSTMERQGRSLGLLAKSITVVGVFSAPMSPNSIPLGPTTTAAQLAVTLAAKWGI